MGWLKSGETAPALWHCVHLSPAKKIGATNAKIYVSGKNLFTFTKWDGWDPETNTTLTPTGGGTVNTALGVTSINAFPVLKSYSLGLEITF